MRRSTRFVLAMSVALSVAGVGPVLAQDSAGVAVNTKDGSSIFKLAFEVHRTMSDVADESDAAAAHGSCEDCRTVAVAIQVVLVMSDPMTANAENVADAITGSCISCETLASAYQYVLGSDGVVHFDAAGNQELTDIRQALVELSKGSDGMAVDAIEAEVGALVDQLYAVIDEHLVVVGAATDADLGVEAGERVPESSFAPEATAEPVPETSPVEETPAATTEPAGEPSAEPEPTTAPTEEPMTEPEPSPSP